MYNRPYTPEWITELKPNEIYQKIVQIGRFFCLYLCMSQKSSNFARHFE